MFEAKSTMNLCVGRSWKYALLGDVCVTSAGGTPLKLDSKNYDGGTIPWLMSGEVGQRDVVAATKFITEKGLASSSAKLFPASSVLIAMYGATAGEVGILRFQAATNQAVCAIMPNEQFLPEFLYYFVLANQQALIATATGNAQPNISQAKIRALRVPIISKAEQEHIVAILDDMSDAIALANASGKKNRNTTQSLLANLLQSIFIQGRRGWARTTIGAQVLLQRGFDITKDQQGAGNVPVVSSGGIKSYHNESMAPGPGVVIGRKGTLGKAFYLESDFWPHDTTLWVKNFKGNNPKLVYYLFSGLDVKRLDSGTANPALNRNQVHPLPIYWPPVADQNAVVSELDSLAKSSQSLISTYERKLTLLNELNQSLLNQAFSGNL